MNSGRVDEFYIECYLTGAAGRVKLADLACERQDAARNALAATLARTYREADAGHIEIRLRGATAADVSAITEALAGQASGAVRRAWYAASVASASGTQHSQFGPEDCAPEAWVREIESLHVADAVWRDASWGNNAAPSWELVLGNVVLAEAFYYTADNGERMSEHFDDRPYVSVVMFDEDDNPTVAFESSPEDFLAVVRAAIDRSGAPAEALVQAAEALPGEGRVYWDRDV